MAVNDRLFEAPEFDAAKIKVRQMALPVRVQMLIQQLSDALVRKDLRTAQQISTEALALAPQQPDVLRLRGLLLAGLGNFDGAVASFESALLAGADDALIYCQYARICEEHGNTHAALRLRRLAVERLPDSPLAWADLGEHLYQHESVEAALVPLERATHLAPDYAPSQLKYGSALVVCGRVEEGAAAVRRALKAEPAFGAAWLELSDIKTVSITPEEADAMRELLRGNKLDDSERIAVEFALARVYEDTGSYQQAFDLLIHANARRRRELPPWSVEQFRVQMERSERAFDTLLASARDSQLGKEVIFIVGMPRSGTTLVEQILSSHHDVTGAGELGDIAQVLTEEATRRRKRYPEWVTEATPQDWQRLGSRYLDLTAKWRTNRPRFTDKMPGNWQALGAIRAMLPGARIVICRRDPLENAWSCFKQFFTPGVGYLYDMEQIGMFWQAFDRAASWWSTHDTQHVREQRYEVLTENPEREIRALLEFCELSFDPACLIFHESRRNVHTLSAAQVRQPMRRHESKAANYGSLLNPLRKALGMPIVATATHDYAEKPSNSGIYGA